MKVPAFDNPMLDPEYAQPWPSGTPSTIMVHPPKQTHPVGFAPWPKGKKRKKRKKK